MGQKPSILLSGGSGLLAVNWFFCKRKEYDVYLGLNKREIKPNGGHIFSLDFSSEEKMKKQLVEINPSMVIHTAGLTSVEKCENNPELAFHVNVELSIMVAKVTKELGITLVHISTDHLFDGLSSLVSEEEPINAINIYGRTKAQAESSVIDTNPEVLIIRTNFYGWGTSYRKSFSDYIIESLRKKQTFSLFDDVYYTPILAENLIKTIHDLIEKKANGIFNIVGDDRISKYNFGILIAEEFELDKSYIKKCSIHDKSSLVRRPKDMSLSNQKVCKLLGRNMGSAKQHISRLYKQEIEEKTKEIQRL